MNPVGSARGHARLQRERFFREETMRLVGSVCILFAALPCIGSAASQPYPARPIRMIVPWPAGGSADILARTLGHKLAENMNQTVVIDNGSTQHLAGELFKSAAGIDLVHVPCKGGAPAVTDLIAKQVSA